MTYHTQSDTFYNPSPMTVVCPVCNSANRPVVFMSGDYRCTCEYCGAEFRFTAGVEEAPDAE